MRKMTSTDVPYTSLAFLLGSMMSRRLSHRLDLNLLELFISSYQTRNLTAAGKELGLSQPAMSRSLARLREAYKDPLFVRQPHGLVPTPFADELYDSANAALEILRRSLDPSAFVPAEEKRTFKIAMSDISEQIFLPVLVKQIAAHAPGIRLETKQLHGVDLSDALASGRVDLAVGYFELAGDAIYRQRLFMADYACIARRDHPAIHGTLTTENFLTLGHVVSSSSITAHAQFLERFLSSPEIQAPIALRVGHFLSIGRIVSETDYISTIPLSLAQGFERAWNVRMHEPPIRLPQYEVVVFWHERFHREAGVTWLRELIKAVLSR